MLKNVWFIAIYITYKSKVGKIAIFNKTIKVTIIKWENIFFFWNDTTNKTDIQAVASFLRGVYKAKTGKFDNKSPQIKVKIGKNIANFKNWFTKTLQVICIAKQTHLTGKIKKYNSEAKYCDIAKVQNWL